MSSSSLSAKCSTGADSQGSEVDGCVAALVACPAPRAPAVIIFDWDDTLLGTSVLQGMPKGSVEFHSLAVLIEQVLRAARSVASVSIVTLSKRPWVFKSSDLFLPALDMSALASELGITIYYALEEDEHCPGAVAAKDWTALKRKSMARCLDEWHAAGALAGFSGDGRALRPSVISIGDSDEEREALIGLIGVSDGVLPERPRCKTIQLMESPSIRAMEEQLEQLTHRLPSLAATKQDFDLRIYHPAEFAPKLCTLGL